MLNLSAGMTVYIIFITAVLGLVMGSFLNCFAYRYANNESVLKGRSHCALCGHTLGSLDLVPVFSWLFLKGRCRYCGERVSARYILAELICAAAYVSVVLKFGVGVSALKYLLLVSLLFAASATDLYCGLIPDRLVIIGAAAAVLFSFLPPDGGFGALLATAIGGLSVSLPMLIIVLIFDKIMKRETMGGGDIKLMFMIGLFFDWGLNILIIIAACVLGLLFAAVLRTANGRDGDVRETELTDADPADEKTFPFGPALCAAAWLVMLFGQGVLDWYIGLFAL